MKRMLKRLRAKLYNIVNRRRVRGADDKMTGDPSGLVGDCSGLCGEWTKLWKPHHESIGESIWPGRECPGASGNPDDSGMENTAQIRDQRNRVMEANNARPKQ